MGKGGTVRRSELNGNGEEWGIERKTNGLKNLFSLPFGHLLSPFSSPFFFPKRFAKTNTKKKKNLLSQ